MERGAREALLVQEWMVERGTREWLPVEESTVEARVEGRVAVATRSERVAVTFMFVGKDVLVLRR